MKKKVLDLQIELEKVSDLKTREEQLLWYKKCWDMFQNILKDIHETEHFDKRV